jgi:hypothetical protein
VLTTASGELVGKFGCLIGIGFIQVGDLGREIY